MGETIFHQLIIFVATCEILHQWASNEHKGHRGVFGRSRVWYLTLFNEGFQQLRYEILNSCESHVDRSSLTMQYKIYGSHVIFHGCFLCISLRFRPFFSCLKTLKFRVHSLQIGMGITFPGLVGGMRGSLLGDLRSMTDRRTGCSGCFYGGGECLYSDCVGCFFREVHGFSHGISH